MSFAELSGRVRDKSNLLQSAKGDKGEELANKNLAQAKRDFINALFGYKGELEKKPAFGSILTINGKSHAGLLREISVSEQVSVKISKAKREGADWVLETEEIILSLNPKDDLFIVNLTIDRTGLSSFIKTLLENEKLQPAK